MAFCTSNGFSSEAQRSGLSRNPQLWLPRSDKAQRRTAGAGQCEAATAVAMAGDAVDEGVEGDEKGPSTSSSRRSRTLHTLSRTFSNDTSSSNYSWYSGTGGINQLSSHEEDPPVHYEKKLCTFSFVLKLAEWIIIVISLGLFSEARIILNYNQEMISFIQVFPFITYWSYMTITGVIILSYLLGQKMREMLIRMYNIIGGAMLFVVATVIFINLDEHWDFYNAPSSTGEKPGTSPKSARMLAAQGVISLVNSCIYFTDTAHSLYISYKNVLANLQQEGSMCR